VSGAPAGACPAWCERHYQRAPDTHTRARRAEGISVMLCQSPGAAVPSLYLGGVRTVLTDAGLLAGTMEELGHPEIAAAVTELAADGAK
jgi:hypothetical protein